MKTIEATWEERNVGVRCFEVEIEKFDQVKDVVNLLRQRNEKYFVAKVLAGRVDILLALQNEGFKFIETNFQIAIDLRKKPAPPAVCANLLTNASYHIADGSEVKKVIEEIARGDIFSTDKVALDPFFSQALAGRRYALWAKDVMDSGKAKMIITEYNGESIGFNILINKGTYFDGFLGGLFKNYLNSGFGFANVYAAVNSARDLGAKKMISGVSSNNFQMMKLHLLFGLKIKRITYILIKHV